MTLHTDTLNALKKPFPRKFIDRVNKGSHSEDYVNHAVVTDRLNRVVPGWSLTIRHIETYHDSGGMPHVAGVHVALTINEVTREEVGTVSRASNYGDELKSCVSDAIKRSAMRFGVAIQLWHELEASEPGQARPTRAPIASQRDAAGSDSYFAENRVAVTGDITPAEGGDPTGSTPGTDPSPSAASSEPEGDGEAPSGSETVGVGGVTGKGSSGPDTVKLAAQLEVLCHEAGLPLGRVFVQATGHSTSVAKIRAGEVEVADLEKAIGAVSEALLGKDRV